MFDPRSDPTLRAAVRMHAALSALVARAAVRRRRLAGCTGQATTEYALVLLAAASIALVLVGWATRSGKLTQLFDAVVDQVIGKAA